MLMIGEPTNELKAGHGADYCRIFMSGGDYLRSREPIKKYVTDGRIYFIGNSC